MKATQLGCCETELSIAVSAIVFALARCDTVAFQRDGSTILIEVAGSQYCRIEHQYWNLFSELLKFAFVQDIVRRDLLS